MTEVRRRTLTIGTASVEVLELDGILFASNLTGEPMDALALVNRLKKEAGEKPVRFSVVADENMERLATLYMRLGAMPVAIVLEYRRPPDHENRSEQS